MQSQVSAEDIAALRNDLVAYKNEILSVHSKPTESAKIDAQFRALTALCETRLRDIQSSIEGLHLDVRDQHADIVGRLDSLAHFVTQNGALAQLARQSDVPEVRFGDLEKDDPLVELGSGATSTVFKVKWSKTPMALKIIHPRNKLGCRQRGAEPCARPRAPPHHPSLRGLCGSAAGPGLVRLAHGVCAQREPAGFSRVSLRPGSSASRSTSPRRCATATRSSPRHWRTETSRASTSL